MKHLKLFENHIEYYNKISENEYDSLYDECLDMSMNGF